MRLRIIGVVQGVGFRPFVWRRAVRLWLVGWVENDPGGVTVEVEGDERAIAAFVDGLAAAAPPLSSVTAVDRHDLPCARGPSGGFAILESPAAGSPAAAVIPADVAPCPACRAEMLDPHDHRFGHAFISCTDCGPRCWQQPTTAIPSGSSGASRSRSRRPRKSGSTRPRIGRTSAHWSYHATVNSFRRCLKVVDTFRRQSPAARKGARAFFSLSEVGLRVRGSSTASRQMGRSQAGRGLSWASLARARSSCENEGSATTPGADRHAARLT